MALIGFIYILNQTPKHYVSVILKANEELYEEAQRLNDKEAAWISEREELQAKSTELSKKK